MRITGGEAKGRTFHFPSRSNSRPTSDFLRETLFNLTGFPEDQFFLDLFAGSGSVGLEALSRKAKKVVFVEKSKSLAGIIRENVSLCGYSEKSLVVAADIQYALRDLCGKQNRFDIVFADPPYHQGLISETLKLLGQYAVLQEAGIIILQHSQKEQPEVLPEGMYLADQRKYGENILTFVRMAVHDTRKI